MTSLIIFCLQCVKKRWTSFSKQKSTEPERLRKKVVSVVKEGSKQLKKALDRINQLEEVIDDISKTKRRKSHRKKGYDEEELVTTDYYDLEYKKRSVASYLGNNYRSSLQ